MKLSAIVLCTLLVVMVAPLRLFSQESFSSEVPFLVENGVLKCTRVIVAFNTNVLPTEAGVTTVDTARFPIRDLEVRSLLDQLSTRYGAITIRKTFPMQVWGDTVVINKRTRVASRVPDISQNFYLDFPSAVPIDSVIAALRHNVLVKYAEPPISVHWLSDPNDPYFASQWNLDTIQAPLAWNIAKGSSAIRIAIIDQSASIVVQNHEDFQLPGGGNKFVGGDSSKGSWHAVWVSGIAGATTNNGIGVASLGWNSSLLGYFLNESTESGTRLPSLIDKASDPAQGNADVINFSWETTSRQNNRDCPFDYNDVDLAVGRAINRGVVVVAAAGNGSYTTSCVNGQVPYLAYPAAYPGVIAVSGTTMRDQFYDTWNYGSFVDISAPAENIWGPYPLPPSYYASGGTSASAPQVCALVALILSINPTADAGAIIMSTADKVDSARYPYVNGWNSHLGHGRINAYQSLAEANGAPAKPTNFSVGTYSSGGHTYPRLTWTPNTEADLSGYDVWRRIISPVPSETTSWALFATLTDPAASQYIDNTINSAGSGPYTARYKIQAFDVRGHRSIFSDSGSVHYGAEKTATNSTAKPTDFNLTDTYPNPFNPSTTIYFELPVDSRVSIVVFDILGREMQKLIDEPKEAGYYSVNFQANQLASGPYFCRMIAEPIDGAKGYSAVKKLLLMK